MIDFLRGKLYSKDIDDKGGISAERDSNAGKVQHRVETDRDENRNTLPILEYREEIEKMIRENETSIIIGETGSGKTTQLPQMVSEVIGEDKKIFVTQPRKMAATSVSGFVAKQNGTRLGDTVGYQIRFDDTTHLGTRISFGTEGILLAKFHEDPLLEEYSCVIVDEAHERNINTDFLLGMLKVVQKRRKEQGQEPLKIIVTSATIEKEKFTDYFGDAPSIEVPGRMYDVEINYLDNPIHSNTGIYQKCAETVSDIHYNEEEGDILIFLPGKFEIDKTISSINELGLNNDLEVLPLHGSLSQKEQDTVCDKFHKRKVIVSTNISETSLTIPGIKYVIDSGLIKQKEYNPRSGIDTLAAVPHSQAGCTQRTGRAGRTGPGKCYRIYTQEDFNKRDSFSVPEIQRSNLASVILQLKQYGINDINDFPLIDPLDSISVNSGIESLTQLSALDKQGKITELGRKISKFPLEPSIARILIEAEKYGAVEEVATIASFTGVRSVFMRPKGQEGEADRIHNPMKDKESDYITFLNIWKEYQSHNASASWCEKNFLNENSLREISKVRIQLLGRLRSIDIYLGNKKATIEDIKKSVVPGMMQHVLVKQEGVNYHDAQNGNASLYIHPSSGLFKGKPGLMIVGSILNTTKNFAINCQVISIDDIKKFAPELIVGTKENTSFNHDGKIKKSITYTLRGRHNTYTENKELSGEELKKEILQYYMNSNNGYFNSLEICKEKIEQLYIKTNGNKKYLFSDDDYMNIYMKKFEGITIETPQDYENEFKKIYTNEYVSLEDFGLSKKEADEINEKHPNSIIINNNEYDVEYYEEKSEDEDEDEEEGEIKAPWFSAIIYVGEEFISEDTEIVFESGVKTQYCYDKYTLDNLEELKECIQYIHIEKLLEEKLTEKLEDKCLSFMKSGMQLFQLSNFDDLEELSNAKLGTIQNKYTNEECSYYGQFTGYDFHNIRFSLTADRDEANESHILFIDEINKIRKDILKHHNISDEDKKTMKRKIEKSLNTIGKGYS